MGALKTIYNVTSNIRPDDAGESSSGRVEHGLPVANGHIEDTTSENELPPRQSRASPLSRIVPAPIQRGWAAVVRWSKGPVPPRPWRIRPFFPRFQTAPLRLLGRVAPSARRKIMLLLFFYFCWLLCFVTTLHYSAFTDEIPGYGSPAVIDCVATFFGPKNSCGINGSSCRPFNDTTFAFRCPASCIKAQVLNPHAVGRQEVNYQPLVIGGPTDPSRSVETAFYRGDSFICASAIHSGFFADSTGGCGVVSLTGDGVDYPASRRNGISSVGFDSSFPLTFKFLPDSLSTCKDLRWSLLAVSVIFSALLALFTTSPSVFFCSIFPGLFFHVALVSDPPGGSDYYTLVSTAIGRFLPAAFVMFVLYKYAIEKTLRGLNAQVEKTILWLGPCWVGCLNNYTFDKIPIQRLTPSDIQAQPGAIVALIIIVLVIFVIALGQAWAIRVAGKLPQYLGLYALMGFCLIMFVAIPNMDLRIHHYFLAMLLLPGTWLQTRPSLIYQGLLVGLFINGIARWGFDSILQTPGELLGDGQIGSLLPDLTTPVVNGTNITFDWGLIPYGYDTVSILVNDVERKRSYYNTSTQYTWERETLDHPEYFRFGYMSGSSTGDYTQAGRWNVDGSWTPMEPGPSR